MNYRLTARASVLIDRILDESAAEFGALAAERYTDLIFLAIGRVAARPGRQGVKAIDRAAGVFAYPLRLLRAAAGRRVRRPPHLVIFRIGEDGVVEVLGVVHERMDLARAARRLLRHPGRG